MSRRVRGAKHAGGSMGQQHRGRAWGPVVTLRALGLGSRMSFRPRAGSAAVPPPIHVTGGMVHSSGPSR